MGRFEAAVLAAIIVALATDWLFLRRMFREARTSYPEIWWPGIRDGETRGASIWSAVLGSVMSIAVVLVCRIAGAHGLEQCLLLAGLIFLAGPFPLLFITFQYVKSDVWLLVSQNLAYLARLLIAGTAAGLFLP